MRVKCNEKMRKLKIEILFETTSLKSESIAASNSFATACHAWVDPGWSLKKKHKIKLY